MIENINRVRVGNALSVAETALDEALLQQANLFAAMVAGRRAVAESAFLGQEALLRLHKVQTSLLSAGNDLGRVHGQLADIDRQVHGDLAQDCPDLNTALVDSEAEAA
ncbi:hypothetical protein GCM10011371_12540 [Novosphingobium marinum]|nr:hypothetical protein GCM10011371_12540 [Novosphingobium marinum]